MNSIIQDIDAQLAALRNVRAALANCPAADEWHGDAFVDNGLLQLFPIHRALDNRKSAGALALAIGDGHWTRNAAGAWTGHLATDRSIEVVLHHVEPVTREEVVLQPEDATP